MEDQKYKKLAQFDRFEESTTQESIKTIFEDDGSINYQIPENNFFKLENPKWIGNTVLHIAFEKYQIADFDLLIKCGADFTIRNGSGETVIHKIVRYIFENVKRYYLYEFVEYALNAHVDFGISRNPTNNYGVSHFHASCVVGNIKATEFFLKNGVSVNDAVSSDSPYYPGYTALHFALSYRRFKVAELLLENGADINATDTKGLSSLHLIIQMNKEIVSRKRNYSGRSRIDLNEKLELFDRLITYVLRDCVDNQWNLTDNIGLSRFHVACMLQKTSLVEKAIEEGADLQLTVNMDSPFLPGYSALHIAAHFNHDTFQRLIWRGNLTAKDSEGLTPFDIFVKRCDGYFLYELIRDRKEWRQVVFMDKRTELLHFVANVRRDRTLKKFLENNVSRLNSFVPFNSPIWPGCTFLHLVVAFIGINDFRDADDNDYDVDLTFEGPGEEDSRHIEIIKNCVEMGADVTIQDIHGSTPLHLAFRNCRPTAVNVLLKYCSRGKIINPVDNDGLSHLHIACAAREDHHDESGELEEALVKFVNSLLRHGTSPNHYLTSSVKWKNQYGQKVFLNVGWTPLHVAVATSNSTLIKILVEHGADIYAKDINGLTPIHLILCSPYGYSDIGNVLLSVVKLKDSIADCGLSHLHIAVYVENKRAVRRLLRNGASDTETTVTYGKSKICNHDTRTNNRRNFRYCNVCNLFIEPLFFVSRFAGYTPLSMRSCVNADIMELSLRHHAKVFAKHSGALFSSCRIVSRDAHWWNSYIIPMLSSNQTLQKCIQEHTGITMLHVHCALLDVDAVVKSLDSGANVNAKVHMDSPLWASCTPLHVVSQDPYFSEWDARTLRKFDVIASLLLEKQADVLCMNAQQNTPIHIAFQRFVRQQNFSAISFDRNYVFDQSKATYVTMLSKNQTDYSVNPTDATGLSHFHITCSCGEVAVVEKFIKHGVDIDSSIDYFSHVDGGFTPLHYALIAQSKEVDDILLKHGADPNSKTCLDNTSLHLAVQCNLTNANLFKSLISAGADMNAKNAYGETPPDSLFKKYSCSKVVEIFLKHGVRVNVFNEKSGEGYIPSIFNSSRNDGICQEPVFRAVILHPRLNGDDEMGRSPIHNIVSTDKRLTSASGYSKAVEKYVEVGFDIDGRDKKGRTALHIATQFKNFVGIHALLDNGADINKTDESRNTPYSYCLQFDERNKNYEFEVFKALKMHINKLLLFALHINDVNKMCDRTICDQFPQVPQKSYQEEVTDLSITKIDVSHTFTLLDFLSETNVVSAYPTMPRVVRDAVDTCFQTCGHYLHEHFPNLVCLLNLQYRKVKSRVLMIDSAKASLDFISSIEIPDLCSDVILRFLANEDLSSLIRSADVEWQPSKRRRLA